MTDHGFIWLYILVAGVAGTYAWRLAGVLLVRRLDPAGPALEWVRAVATALVAALVARMTIFPSGLLAQTSATARIGALAVGLAVWRFAGRKVEAGIAAAVTAFLLLQQFFP